MKGHIRQRGARSFELKLDVGKNAAGRVIEYRSFKGTRAAKRKPNSPN
jgi:hypothetical protein